MNWLISLVCGGYKGIAIIAEKKIYLLTEKGCVFFSVIFVTSSPA